MVNFLVTSQKRDIHAGGRQGVGHQPDGGVCHICIGIKPFPTERCLPGIHFAIPLAEEKAGPIPLLKAAGSSEAASLFFLPAHGGSPSDGRAPYHVQLAQGDIDGGSEDEELHCVPRSLRGEPARTQVIDLHPRTREILKSLILIPQSPIFAPIKPRVSHSVPPGRFTPSIREASRLSVSAPAHPCRGPQQHLSKVRRHYLCSWQRPHHSTVQHSTAAHNRAQQRARWNEPPGSGT